MITGRTTKRTIHGNFKGGERILQKDLLVRLVPVTSCPHHPDPGIKWWACPLAGHLWFAGTALLAKSNGVGLKPDEVEVIPEVKVTIDIHEGIVQQVHTLEKGITVCIRDYDAPDLYSNASFPRDDVKLLTDEEGRKYIQYLWYAGGYDEKGREYTQ